MYELLYSSVCPDGLSESELTDLLTSARSKNKKLGVTGMLVYHEREIMQLLEGEESVVTTLFKTILEDSRHTSVEVFYEGSITDRAFKDWSMAFKRVDKENIDLLLPGYEEFSRDTSPINAIKNNPNRGKNTFLSLRNML